jgi:hypothetical protein
VNDVRPSARPWPRDRLRAVGQPAGLLAAALASLGVAIAFWSQGGQDDTYITYWPAKTLAEHGEIVNYNGLRLEQSSSLSLVVVLALIYKLTPWSMPTVGFLTSLAAALATGLIAVRLARRMGLQSRIAVVTATLTAAPFGYWATSGTETPLTAFAALWFIDALTQPSADRDRGTWLKLAAAALLFAGVRPEAPVLLIGIVIAFVILGLVSPSAERKERGSHLKSDAARAGVGVAAVAIVLGFRKLYFNAWWPNPATLKSQGFDAGEGLVHLWDVSLRAGVYPLMLAAAGAAVVAARYFRGAPDRVAALVIALGLGQVAFIVISGGDWMIGGRFLAPIVPALVLVGFLAIEAAVPAPRTRDCIAAGYTLLNLIFAVQLLHQGHSDGQPLWTMQRVFKRAEKRLGADSFARVELLNQVHRRDAFTTHALLPIADAVVAHVKTRPVYVMTGQAGMIAYHLASRHFRRVVILDLWSLTDRQLIDCFPPGTVQTGKWGTFLGAYPLSEHEALTARCQIPLPDIYYNETLLPSMQALLERLGYDVIYQQTGHIGYPGAVGYDPLSDQVGRVGYPGPAKFLRSHNSADGHIAVRKKIARAVGLKPKPAWSWNL